VKATQLLSTLEFEVQCNENQMKELLFYAKSLFMLCFKLHGPWFVEGVSCTSWLLCLTLKLSIFAPIMSFCFIEIGLSVLYGVHSILFTRD